MPGLLAVLIATACLLGAMAPAGAEPRAGVYRLTVGDFEVVALSDGAGKRPVGQQLQLLYGDREKNRDALTRAYPDGQVDSTVNAFLIDTGAKLVLVDTGNGQSAGPAMGRVLANLRAAGYQPENIAEIYLTHMHGDHLGGLVAGTERVFPNATVYVHQLEADYWLNESNLAAAPASVQRTFQAAKKALAPYIDAGKFKTFAGNITLTPGIRAEAAFGHTPGHTAYFVESKGETLVLWGDIIHVAAVQFADPAVTIAYDSDTAVAAQTRRQLLAAAADNGWLIGGAHLAFPAFGHARATADGGYAFTPLD